MQTDKHTQSSSQVFFRGYFVLWTRKESTRHVFCILSSCLIIIQLHLWHRSSLGLFLVLVPSSYLIFLLSLSGELPLPTLTIDFSLKRLYLFDLKSSVSSTSFVLLDGLFLYCLFDILGVLVNMCFLVSTRHFLPPSLY